MCPAARRIGVVPGNFPCSVSGVSGGSLFGCSKAPPENSSSIALLAQRRGWGIGGKNGVENTTRPSGHIRGLLKKGSDVLPGCSSIVQGSCVVLVAAWSSELQFGRHTGHASRTLRSTIFRRVGTRKPCTFGCSMAFCLARLGVAWRFASHIWV